MRLTLYRFGNTWTTAPPGLDDFASSADECIEVQAIDPMTTEAHMPDPIKPGSDAHMERLAIRMLYKVCPAKSTHSHETGEWNVQGEHCPQCGIGHSDFDRFIMGDDGKPHA